MIVFYTEASEKIGFGHLVECVSIANFIRWRKDVPEIRFYLNPYSFATDYLRRRGLKYKVIAGLNAFKKNLIIDHPKLCICNLRFISLIAQKIISKLGLRNIVIDELGNKKILADVLINASAIKQWHNYTYLGHKPLALFGPEYMIIKSAFKRYNKKDKRFKSNSVVVSMGGVDRSGSTLKILKALRELRWIKKTVIIGPGFAHRGRLKEILLTLDTNNKILHSPCNMAKLLYESDVVFNAGGDILYEASCVGTPSIVLWEDKHECMQAKWFHTQGAALNLGRGIKVSEAEIKEATVDLLQNIERRKIMSEKGKSTINGVGIERVGKIIKDYLKT